jgi:hypothetical protein
MVILFVSNSVLVDLHRELLYSISVKKPNQVFHECILLIELDVTEVVQASFWPDEKLQP